MGPEPCWWDRFFALEASYSQSFLSIKLHNCGLTDQDCYSVALALQRFLDHVDPKLPLHVDLDASSNHLGDLPTAQLLWTLRGASYLRRIKLYKNRVGDATCRVLASLLWQQQEACEEIHLSHNEISHRGVIMLLATLAMHPKEAYPRTVEHLDEAVPCWLRLEHNQATSIEHLLEALQKDPVRLRYCLLEPGCSAFRCSLANQPETAHVHLLGCGRQKDAPGLAAQLQLESSVLEIVDQLGHLQSPKRKQEELPTGPMPQSLPLRHVTLRVTEEGAGLEMTAHAYGYYVDAVDAEPGQDLSEGDVLLSVDGAQLWGDLSEEELNEAFGREFADGATVTVARATELQGSRLWQCVPLLQRAKSCLTALTEDLSIMASSLGVQAELDLGAIWLTGPVKGQREAIQELANLLRFYFPEFSNRDLPPCQWVPIEPEEVRAAPKVHPAPEIHENLGQWESALLRQWQEDDDIFDEDLPVEPLEAPDEGPETFEGEIVLPDLDLSQPFKILILVGLPGSGKSSLAARLAGGYDIINQDALGDRKACVQAARESLAKNRRIIVDRCNCTRLQRRVWLDLAEDYEVAAACVWLDVPEETCGERVLQRFGHKTLDASEKSLEVIKGFQQRFEAPMETEGLVRWRVRDDADLEEALAELDDLVQDSEAGRLPEADVPCRKRRRLGPEDASAGRPNKLRRQVEYYFSDRNLKKDGFFQEKISSEPEPGWLELRWIMSCPRIVEQGVSEQEVLKALEGSQLEVKEAEGSHWLKREQPLPPLEDWSKTEALDGEQMQRSEQQEPQASEAADVAIQQLLDRDLTENEDEVTVDPYL